jgi:hypothetical protein
VKFKKSIVNRNSLKYSELIDRDSAYEILIKKIDAANEQTIEEEETNQKKDSTATTLGKSALKIVTSASFIRGA